MRLKIIESIKVIAATLAMFALFYGAWHLQKEERDKLTIEKVSAEKLLKTKLQAAEIEIQYWKQIADSLRLEDSLKDSFIIKKQVELHRQDSAITALNTRSIQLMKNRHEKEVHLYGITDTSELIRLFTALHFTPRQGASSQR